MRIYKETPLHALVVADTVIAQLQRYLDRQLPTGYAERLDLHAQKTYENNPAFARRLRGPNDTGRDALYAFMRHWLAAYLKLDHPEIFKLLPDGFATGEAPPTPAVARKL